MRLRVRLSRHRLHPMIVTFPTAMFPLALALDGVDWYLGDPAFWTVGIWVALLGLLSTLAAAATGTVDLASEPERAPRAPHRVHPLRRRLLPRACLRGERLSALS